MKSAGFRALCVVGLATCMAQLGCGADHADDPPGAVGGARSTGGSDAAGGFQSGSGGSPTAAGGTMGSGGTVGSGGSLVPIGTGGTSGAGGKSNSASCQNVSCFDVFDCTLLPTVAGLGCNFQTCNSGICN